MKFDGRIKYYIAKEWMIIMVLLLLSFPVAGIIYFVNEYSVNNKRSTLEDKLNKVEDELLIFEPSKYLQKYHPEYFSSSFDPDKYLAEKSQDAVMIEVAKRVKEENADFDSREVKKPVGELTLTGVVSDGGEVINKLAAMLELEKRGELPQALTGQLKFLRSLKLIPENPIEKFDDLMLARDFLQEKIYDMRWANEPYILIQFLSLLAVPFFWIASVIIRFTIWSWKTLKKKSFEAEIQSMKI